MWGRHEAQPADGVRAGAKAVGSLPPGALAFFAAQVAVPVTNSTASFSGHSVEFSLVYLHNLYGVCFVVHATENASVE